MLLVHFAHGPSSLIGGMILRKIIEASAQSVGGISCNGVLAASTSDENRELLSTDIRCADELHLAVRLCIWRDGCFSIVHFVTKFG